MKKEQIIDKHIEALLNELIQHGIPAIGIAGGITLDKQSPAGGSMCHVFFVVLDNIVSENGTFDGNDYVNDVAGAMARSAKADAS